MLRTKNLNLLPILLALLEEESVAASARRVHLSQPAVSGALARLRIEFEDPLLVRVGRGMRRTNRAEHLLPHVKQSCAELERLFGVGVFNPAGSGERFVVAAPDHLSFLLTRELLPILDDEAKGVKIHFTEPPTDLPRHLIDGTIDLGIAGNFGLWTEASYQPLFHERFVAVMDRAHPLAGRTQVEEREIARYVRVTRTTRQMGPSQGSLIQTGIPVLDFDPQVSIEQFTDAALLTIGTEAVVPAPERLVNHLTRIAPIVSVPFTADNHVEAGLFWAPFRDEAPEILWLRSLIERCFAQPALALSSPPDV